MQLPPTVRLLLAELELLSHGSTASWNSAGGHDADDAAAVPFGESHPPHLELRAEYQRQDTESGRVRVVARMRAVLREHRGGSVDRSRVVGETLEEENDRIVIEGDGFPAGEVARRFKTTLTRVRRLRLADGRDADMGRKVRVGATTAPPTPAEAHRMSGDGMSVRQIGLALGKQPTTIARWLKQEAA